MDARVEGFSADVEPRFKFLVDKFGFSGPEFNDGIYAGYSRPPWAVWVVLDLHDKTVDTFVWYETEGRTWRYPMWYLIRVARIKGAGQVRNSSQTRAGVQKSLTVQAGALRLLVPYLLEKGDSMFVVE